MMKTGYVLTTTKRCHNVPIGWGQTNQTNKQNQLLSQEPVRTRGSGTFSKPMAFRTNKIPTVPLPWASVKSVVYCCLQQEPALLFRELGWLWFTIIH